MVPGLTGEVEMVVGPEDLVSRWGSVPVDVLSTPRLIRLLEEAAVQTIREFISPGQMTLGTQVRMRHLAPTPLGMKVRAYALLSKVDGNRLLFSVDAYDEVEKVAEGEHERMVVSKERFEQKVDRKAMTPHPSPSTGEGGGRGENR